MTSFRSHRLAQSIFVLLVCGMVGCSALKEGMTESRPNGKAGTPSTPAMGQPASTNQPSKTNYPTNQPTPTNWSPKAADEEGIVWDPLPPLPYENDPHAQTSQVDAMYPPNPTGGHCYVKVIFPPRQRTGTKQVLKREPFKRVQVTPGQYDWVEEQKLVREASEKIVEISPARYEWVIDSVKVTEDSFRIVEIPPEYEIVQERVLQSESYTMWKETDAPILGEGVVDESAGTRVDEKTGKVMCLVRVPARYKTIQKRVLKRPASTQRIRVPGEYQTMRKQVMVERPNVQRVPIPAQYETVRVRKMVRPPQEREVEIPAEYRYVKVQERFGERTAVWKEILCEYNVTPDVVREVQSALWRRGHYTGPINGQYDRPTLMAIESFKNANRLMGDGLTFEALDAMGVELYKEKVAAFNGGK